MPMYEFRCPNCGLLTTELCKIGEDGELLTCPKCGHVGLMKKISGFSSPGSFGGTSSGGCSSGCHGNCAGCH